MIQSVLSFMQAHMEAIAVGLVDGVILLIPSLKSSNVLQLIGNVCADVASAISKAVNEPEAK